MDPALIVAIISVAVVAISVLVAYLQWRENHSDRKVSKLEHVMKEIAQNEIKEELGPLATVVNDHTIRMTQNGSRLNRIEDLLKEISSNQRDFADKQSQMGVKVDMYWTTLEQLAMNSAKGLHQPDPRRAHIDHLLEAFMEGTLTPEERLELKKILIQIRNFEPHKPSEDIKFPVYPGEQTFATILLSTMDVVDPRKMASMGHASHRSTAHAEQRNGYA